MLEIKKVTKTFGDIKALEDVTVDINKGEFVFICGPSGAGKTTLLRLILRELLPDSGEIILEGHDITKLSQKEVPLLRQKIGVVFQDYKIIPERTLRENTEVALAVCGIPQKEWGGRVDQVLKLVGLSERESLFPSQLSGGEIQRASLARALVANPRLVLADEPTGNLDWDTADSIMELLKKINEEGKTVVMATHHRLIVDKLKKRVVEISEGKIIKGGASPLPSSEKGDKASKDESKEQKTQDKLEKSAKKSQKSKIKVKVEEA